MLPGSGKISDHRQGINIHKEGGGEGTAFATGSAIARLVTAQLA